ncbi:DUF1508 domain-containing protein [Natronoarchaeum rubrum]|uniref:DUF1508 domain-containing protein n=1 Tax=Natronoarchaeum rubrum TaxID=755311 RepID=UPI0021110409|nr:DUF1508 domain-containing protein [Natronoarchaeum rubrum]HMB50014.1 DUF1508 domain-containing protein [Natronoarchaeum rubrum]
MSQATAGSGFMFSLYEQYIGEPKSKKQVYGYWLFLIGCLIGFAGVALFITTINSSTGNDLEVSFTARLAYTLAGLGLPIAIFGIVLLLPVRERAIHATLGGLAITVLGIFGFNVAYPSNWAGVGQDYTIPVIAVYATGLAVIAGVVVLVPILTGKEGMLVEDEVRGLDAHPPVLVGQQNHGTLFSVFRRPGEEWTWRAVQQSAIATSVEAANSRTAAKDAVGDLKSKVSNARLLEITTAAFRLYEDEQGVWRWVLLRDDGSVAAESGERYDSRDATEDSVSFTKDQGPSAPVLDIDGAAFDVYRDGDDWRWNLLDEDRSVIAEGAEAYGDEASADDAADEVANRIGDARVLAVDPFGVELYEDGDGWRWRLLDAEDDEVAVGEPTFDSRREAEADADELLGHLSDATVVEKGSAGYELYEDDGGWRWRLLDDEDDIVAESNPEATDRSAVRSGAERMAAAAEDAEAFEIDDADYEIYPGADGWHWRFVAEDRRVIADRTGGYETPEDAEDAIERVREQALEADLLEFETAAFQQYQTVAGDWRWRLIDEGGAVLADSGQAYDSKDDAGNAMATLKEKAPDADLLEIETAAFELFEDDGGDWGWRLIDEGGRLVADGADRHATKQGAREAMDFLVDHSPDADVRTVEGAGFQLYTDDADDWRWRCVHESNDVLALSPDGHATRDEAAASVDEVRPTAADAAINAVEHVAFEVDPGRGRRWDVIDRHRETLVEGREQYADAEEARQAIERLRSEGGDATIFAIDEAAIRLSGGSEGWRWELIDRDRTVYARSAGSYDVRARAATVIDEVRSLAPEAGELDFETAGFELVREDGQWYWQLLNADETVVAEGSTGYEDRGEAVDAIDRLREMLGTASVLEIDDPTFEVHQRDGGWIWRLVDEHGDALAESVETYPTRSAARERMNTLKEHAPSGALSVAG